MEEKENAWKFTTDKPIYIQIKERLVRDIIKGVYKTEETLPSVRDFALMAGVNPNTMQRALSELERDNLVITDRTSGRKVTGNTKLLKDIKTTLAKSIKEKFIFDMKEIGISKSEIKL